MIECQEWMLDPNQWSKIPKPYEGWNHIGWYIVTEQDKPEDKRKGTQEQSQMFDFSFSIMLQKETGWN
jgi:hypothetical protein